MTRQASRWMAGAGCAGVFSAVLAALAAGPAAANDRLLDEVVEFTGLVLFVDSGVPALIMGKAATPADYPTERISPPPPAPRVDNEAWAIGPATVVNRHRMKQGALEGIIVENATCSLHADPIELARSVYQSSDGTHEQGV